MTLEQELAAVRATVKEKLPDLAQTFDHDVNELIKRGVGQDGPGVGDPAPDFELTDHLNRPVHSAELRKEGPLVITFYRGHW